VSLDGDEREGFDDCTEDITAATTPTTEPPTGPSVTVPLERPDGDPAAALTPARAAALIDSFDPSQGPALYFLHLILPHQPFNRYPDGTEYRVIDPLGISLPEDDSKHLHSWSPWTSAVSEQQHLLQAQYADQVLGQVLTGLREAGLYDDSLVIVASDHGMSFEVDTAGRYVDDSTVDAIAYAPLLVKPPGQTDGRVDDANVSIVDLLPTIAEIVGVEVGWSVDGAPIGSDAVAERGDAKQIYDMIGFGGLKIRRIIDFDDREEFATVGDRVIGGLPDPDAPLSALDEHLGISDLVGRRLDARLTDDGVAGSVSLHELAAIREPGDAPLLGLVTGDVNGPVDQGARLLLAIDGVIVGGSGLSTDSDGRDGRIAVLLPPGTLDAQNEVRAALIEPDGDTVELEVRSF
jgi:hypothetical protein